MPWKARLFRFSLLSLLAVLTVPTARIKAVDTSGFGGTSLFFLSPKPHRITLHGAGFPLDCPMVLTHTPHVSRDNVDYLKEVVALHAHQRKIVNGNKNRLTPITIVLAMAADDKLVNREYRAMGVAPVHNLIQESYIILTGFTKQGEKRIALIANDDAGLYFGEQTLDQLFSKHALSQIPSMTLVDWPSLPFRGIIEGFYGKPWSLSQRISLLDFCSHHKMNMYIYAPKGDPYHRRLWKSPYPSGSLRELQQLIHETTKRHMQFVFALSPGSTIRYTHTKDVAALVKKSQIMWNCGVRSFAIFFDDIRPQLRYEEERLRFGYGQSGMAEAQAHVLNAYYTQFIATHPGTRLLTVPTEYSEHGHTLYRDRFAQKVDPSIMILWTGNGVITRTLSVQDLLLTKAVFRHPLVLWDNYPVNDYQPSRLFLRPLTGRSPLLSQHGLLGIVANPMMEPVASTIPLYTIADYAWNSEAYQPQVSWDRALHELGGKAYLSLRHFADWLGPSPLSTWQKGTVSDLQRKIGRFWQTYRCHDPIKRQVAFTMLDDEFHALANAQRDITIHMSPEFVQETRPWLAEMTRQSILAQKTLHQLQGHGKTIKRKHTAKQNSKSSWLSPELQRFIERASLDSD